MTFKLRNHNPLLAGARAFMRGHEVIWIQSILEWLYSDDLTLYDDSRTCARCGQFATPESYDACLGHIPGAISACCGHGVGDKIAVMI